MTFNINDEVKVKLTEDGHRAIHDYYDAMAKTGYKEPLRTIAVCHPTDKDGYNRFQLWVLMQLFGPVIGMTSPAYFKGNEILIEEPK